MRGDAKAQYEAARLVRDGKLKGVSPLQAKQWTRRSAAQGYGPACWELARGERGEKQFLECAAKGRIAEAQLELGMRLLDDTAAEDEPRRFEGLSWVALSAQSGYGAAVRRWELVASQLVGEELEYIEQKTKAMGAFAVQPPKTAVQ